MDSTALECCNGALYEAGFVQSVRMDVDLSSGKERQALAWCQGVGNALAYLDIVLVTDGQRSINRLGRSPPILVQFQSNGACFNNVLRRLHACARIIAFTGKPKVHRDTVCCCHHGLHVEFA